MTFMQSGVLDSIRKNRVALKGPMMTAAWRAGRRASTSDCARRSICTATLRPVKNLDGVHAFSRSGPRHHPRKHQGSLRGPQAHRGARRRRKPQNHHRAGLHAHREVRISNTHATRRKKIHAIHKANIMKLSDGLFLTSTRAVAASIRTSNTKS